ncbi:MAG: hypothetical protein JWP92_2979 [Caulobacter sp.]|nr:hypothetical protein [Caulobacter sp.]
MDGNIVMSASLRVVAAPLPTQAAPASLGARVHQLQAEAKRLAGEHVDLLTASLIESQKIADEIAQGGDAYPPGVRDIARRLAEDAAAKALMIEAIMARL